MSEVLPNLVVIGAMKAGTTSLWRYLDAHPQVFMAPEKELRFFVDGDDDAGRWGKGVAWYAERFAGATEPVRGEASPRYTRRHLFPGVPERMAAVLPDVRLLYLVRDPVVRMVSQYLMAVDEGRERLPVERALVENSDYVDTSRYAWQLDAYLDHLPRERILVVPAEDLRDRREATLHSIARFVGIEERWPEDSLAREENVTRRRGVRRRWAASAREWAVWKAAGRRAPDPLREVVRRVTVRRDVGNVAVGPDLERRLRDRLAPDAARLRDFIGPDFDGWGLLR